MLRYRAFFFKKRVARQYHIGILRCFGHHDVLHNNEIELFKRFDHVMLVRIRHHRIFTKDVERLYIAGDGGVKRLNDGKTRFH